MVQYQQNMVQQLRQLLLHLRNTQDTSSGQQCGLQPATCRRVLKPL